MLRKRRRNLKGAAGMGMGICKTWTDGGRMGGCSQQGRDPSTLDKNGRLDELPFMPQMFQYCGQRLRVIKRAHRLCDTQFATEGRAMNDAVVIEGLRCDGQNYGGCEMGCVLIWKEAWLKRASESAAMSATPAAAGAGCTEADLRAATVLPPLPDAIPLGATVRLPGDAIDTSHRATVILVYSTFRGGLQIRERPIGKSSSGIFVAVYYNLAESGLGFGSAMRWVYDKVQGLRGKRFMFIARDTCR